MGAIICPKCAAPVPAGEKTCLRCGRPLAAAALREAEGRERRAAAYTARIAAVLLVLYMAVVVGFFVYEHLL
jgi:predicted amidophosphoribosyltransferase